MSERPVAPTNCFFQGCYNPAYEAEIRRAKDACHRFNQLFPNDREAHLAILRELLGEMGRETVITPPFWCDYGYNITVGDFFYSNHNLIITDGARVAFGDHVFVAPNCCFTTAEHAIDPEMRKAGIEVAKPITVGNNVWIGAGSTILAGVKIGDNSVIGAGSAVTSQVHPGKRGGRRRSLPGPPGNQCDGPHPLSHVPAGGKGFLCFSRRAGID